VSQTVLQIDAKVKVHTNDILTGREVFSREVRRGKIDSALRGTIATRLSLGQTYVSGALAIGPAANTYSLPSTSSYRYIKQVRTQSLGRNLDVVPYEALMARLNHIKDPAQFKAYPMECAFWEQPDGVVQVKFYPWPVRDDAVDLMESVLPNESVADDTVVPLDDAGCEALAYEAALQLILMANAEQLNALRISPNVANVYMANRDIALRESRKRMAALRNAGRTRQTRR